MDGARSSPDLHTAQGSAPSCDPGPVLAEHAERLQSNMFLRAIHEDMYTRLIAEVSADQFPRAVEVGSGAGFLRRHAPHVTTSDCVEGPGIDHVVDACRLQQSFGAGGLDAIVGLNVFHHLPDVVGFLRGAETVLRSGGRVALVEPWFTPVGQWFYRLLHHEPVLLDPDDWSIQGEGRLTGANSRLPTSVFSEGRSRLAQVAPRLAVVKCEPFHKWLYLLSGGLRLNTRVPSPIARGLLWLDRTTSALDSVFGIFALIVLERQ